MKNLMKKYFKKVGLKKFDKILKKELGYENGLDDFISVKKENLKFGLIKKKDVEEVKNLEELYVVDKNNNIIFEMGCLGILKVNLEEEINN